jgi:hypothetical protein
MRWVGFFTPKGFLAYGGGFLLALGLVGFFALNDASQTPAFYLDDVENRAHLGVGLIALAVVLVPGLRTASAPFHGWLVTLLGLTALFVGVYGFYVGDNPAPNTLGVTNLESPADDLLNLALAGWALWAAWRAQPEGTQPTGA